ncbi:MAG: DUF5000 domain-containing lipoprotein [Mangrovibacterium sp.]
MKQIIYTCILLAGLFLSGCEDPERGIPVSENDIPPAPVSNVEVKNIPGGATLSYALPKSESLLYVLAEYSIQNGAVLEKKSSYYNNSITLEGFPDTNPYEVKLYAVSRADKKSEPVTATIHPLTPPVKSVYETLSAIPTFGGVNVRFENENEADLKITVLTTDSYGDLYPAETYYTKRKSGSFSVRGFDPVKRKFGFYVRDRWENYSDTLFAELIPLFEEKMDKSKFRGVQMASDTYQPHLYDGLINLWDDVWNVEGPVFHTKPINGNIPQWFTMDLGVTAKLSRFKFYHRRANNNGQGTNGQYNAGDPEILEVYGSNNPSDSWDNWTLLGRFQSVKPSGSPNGVFTAEDIQFACVDGEDFEFSLDIPPVRYLRVKTLKVWGGVTYVYIGELTFWGEVQKVSK